MAQSISYYLIIAVLKLKGIKKTFSEGPINYKKVRKEDVHKPKGSFFKRHISRVFEVQKTLITEIQKDHTNNDKLLLFLHGGAFISGPAQHHWGALKQIVNQTGCTVWMCAYPKAPEYTITNISDSIDEVYAEALKSYSGNQIILMGDSAGGTLVTALTQCLVQYKIELPKKVILISPVMDATMTNPEIETIDHIDPMLSRIGVLSAKQMCAGSSALDEPRISPIHGDFKGFPETILFAADHDIMFPDELLALKQMQEAGVTVDYIEGKNMPHIWPLLPVMKEAKDSLKMIIEKIKN